MSAKEQHRLFKCPVRAWSDSDDPSGNLAQHQPSGNETGAKRRRDFIDKNLERHRVRQPLASRPKCYFLNDQSPNANNPSSKIAGGSQETRFTKSVNRAHNNNGANIQHIKCPRAGPSSRRPPHSNLPKNQLETQRGKIQHHSVVWAVYFSFFFLFCSTHYFHSFC